MKILPIEELARTVQKALPSGAKALCVIQDWRVGQEYLATVLATWTRTTVEYIVWRMNLASTGLFGGRYYTDLETAWGTFTRQIPGRLYPADCRDLVR